MISRGEFGPIALRRILDLLDRFGIKSTFFIPGHSAVAFPEPTRMIRAAGHEIGHHGWVHENPTMLTPEQERQVLERGLEALDRIAGARPVGYRSPAWDNSPATVSLLLEYGFEYESSLMGSDYAPYWCRVGDEFSTTEEYRWGRPVDLVEVPVAWHLDDFPPFEHVRLRSGAVLQGNAPPSSVGEVWLGEFDYLYHHVGSSRWSRYPDDHDASAGDRARASLAFPRTMHPPHGRPSRGDLYDGWRYVRPLAQGTQTRIASRCRPGAFQGMGSASAPAPAARRRSEEEEIVAAAGPGGCRLVCGLRLLASHHAMARALKLAGSPLVGASLSPPSSTARREKGRGDFAKHSPPIVLRWMLLPVGSTDPAYSDPLGVHGPGPKEYIPAARKPACSGSIVKCSNERLPLHETSYCSNNRTSRHEGSARLAHLD
jgi:peptidoglycan/xylan/chitin deacetylase (PgdA/CDA1 family)